MNNQEVEVGFMPFLHILNLGIIQKLQLIITKKLNCD